MADQKVSDMTIHPLDSPGDNDVFYCGYYSGGVYYPRKVQGSQLRYGMQIESIEVTGSLTAANNRYYIATANAVFTDPTGVQGKGFTVYVRSGISTIGGVAFTAGSYVIRTYHSGAWSNKEVNSLVVGTTKVSGGTSGNFLIEVSGVLQSVPITIDTVPTDGSTNPINSNAVFDALALKQDLIFKSKTTAVSSTLTGSTSETELVRITIPANSLSASDILRIDWARFVRNTGGTSNITHKVKVSTSGTLPSGTTGQIATLTQSTSFQIATMDRHFVIRGGNIIGILNSSSQTTDVALINIATSSQAFDVTVTNYIHISSQLITSGDSVYLDSMSINNI